MKQYILPCTLLFGTTLTMARPAYNIVFIISDQHKASIAGCYGDSVVRTPHIDALAQRGVLFNHCYTPSPLSAPARASLITGVNPHQHGVLTHFLDIERNGKVIKTGPGKYPEGYNRKFTTWGEYFKMQGYRTAAIGKMHVHGELQRGVSKELPEGNLMGFDHSDMRLYTSFPGGHYRNYKDNPDINKRYRENEEYDSIRRSNNFNEHLRPTLVRQEDDLFDFVVARKSCDFIARCAIENQPFVIHVGLEKPHKPWTTVQRFYDLYSTDQMRLPHTLNDTQLNGRYPYVRKPTQNRPATDEEIRRSMLAYYACVTEMDEAVGRIVEQVKRSGLYDRTLFVYTSDHGEHLYEHGFHEKHNMYESAVRIPFIISCPSLLPQNVRCNQYASLIDVLPTLADLIGSTSLPQWEGISLVSSMKNGSVVPRTLFSEIAVDDFLPFHRKRDVLMRMLLNDDFKYVYTHGMIDQLYDRKHDHWEMCNKATESHYRSLTQHYRFLTLVDWYPPGIGRMKSRTLPLDDKEVEIRIENSAFLSSLTVWGCKKGDVAQNAQLIETEWSKEKNEWVCRMSRSLYSTLWVMGDWKLTRTGERSEKTPMITEKFPELLPITAIIEL